jgi:1-acyl-sn-glycerol-3-phosphate acyltransferase
MSQFDADAEAAQTCSLSPTGGANVRPCRFGCGVPARIFRRLVGSVILAATRALLRIRTEGLQNIETLAGPAIFAATHESKLDGVVLLAALPARWHYRMAVAMGDWIFWQGWFGGRRIQLLRYYVLVLLTNVFTLPPNPGGLRRSLRHVDFLTGRGWSILIFPEGIHTPWLLPFQPGVGWIAQHSGLPVVPVYIEGMGAILPRDGRWARRGCVRIRFGKPMYPEALDSRTFTARIEEFVHSMRPREL